MLYTVSVRQILYDFNIYKARELVNGLRGIAIPTFEPDLDNANVGNGCFSAHKTSAPADSVGAFLTDKRKEVFLYE